MKAKCFECDADVEGDDLEAVAGAMVAHGCEFHTWAAPEQAIRNYARNYAEAAQRVTGGTARLPAIGEVTIRPVTEARIDDWLSFFDYDAFADNPGTASCYCLGPHRPPTEAEPERPWRETRKEMVGRLRDGTAFGYLAYVDGQPAGWVNASLRSNYVLFRNVDPDGPNPQAVVGVSCFVVAPPYRRHGIAGALLDRVIADGSTRGASWIEGYPLSSPGEGQEDDCRGSNSMYQMRGFETVEVREGYSIVRRSVERWRAVEPNPSPLAQ